MIHIVPFTVREYVLLGFVVMLIGLLVFATHRVQELTRKTRQEQRKLYKRPKQH